MGYLSSIPGGIQRIAKLKCAPHRSASAFQCIVNCVMVPGKYICFTEVHYPRCPQPLKVLSANYTPQCMYYGHKKPLWLVMTILLVTLSILGGFEAGMIFAIRVCLWSNTMTILNNISTSQQRDEEITDPS